MRWQDRCSFWCLDPAFPIDLGVKVRAITDRLRRATRQALAILAAPRVWVIKLAELVAMFGRPHQSRRLR
jgi:hypothetical protein